ncbi:protein containing RelA/SpoT domain [Pseudovibrio sp. FO-BEG1]|uniref:GTP pyrophosphokinase n=1 Tax=unclassified Pseudovibrio TaxID=2627060 RepID=UPI000186C22A|nr:MULTISPECIES: GTP pyrophosphokinase [unclassified Pseudovibrio]AEV37251.1 protein containing RelA/SpoT domain [Pseudovibrio sp. FO-BEG1]EEA92638.1 putative GTP pyrophosphokinase [Pseudovibrio sp. JE062]
MSDIFNEWLEDNLRHYENLTNAVVSITQSLLANHKVPYLTITGRTKDKASCVEKAARKSYQNPRNEMTDISGVRIVLFFESDIDRVCKLVEEHFAVDYDNSLNKQDLLSTNEVGYRSVHFVCDIGETRHDLPEYSGLKKLKFEFQVRTVLQHAWAEMAHDRSYKFSGKLPQHLERELYLLSGLLESADKGFDRLSREIDAYQKEVSEATSHGILEIPITYTSLLEYFKSWAKANSYTVNISENSDHINNLISELSQYGVTTIAELADIIPPSYVKVTSSISSYIFGVVRDWMIIHDPERFCRSVKIDWLIDLDDINLYSKFLKKEQIEFLKEQDFFTPGFLDEN